MSGREKKSFGLRKSLSFFLFVASFSPLFIYYFIINFEKVKVIDNTGNGEDVFFTIQGFVISLVILGLIIFGSFLIVYLFLRDIEKEGGGNTITIESSESKNIDCGNYLMTYVFFFLGTNIFESLSHLIGAILLRVCIGVIYLRSNIIYINPLFMLYGYSIYEVAYKKDKGLKTILVLCKKFLQKNDNVKLIQIKNNFYFGK